jgi:hypothetical protein
MVDFPHQTVGPNGYPLVSLKMAIESSLMYPAIGAWWVISFPSHPIVPGLHLGRAQDPGHGEAAFCAPCASLCHAEAQDLAPRWSRRWAKDPLIGGPLGKTWTNPFSNQLATITSAVYCFLFF